MTLLSKWPVNNQAYDCFFNGNVIVGDYFAAAFSKVKPSKSPGAPLVFVTSTNEPLADLYYDEFKESVENRLFNYETLGECFYDIFLKDPSEFISLFLMDPESRAKFASFLVDNNFTDCVLLKVKSEPRKLEKQPRLVCMVSVIDNMASRFIIGDMLYDEQLSVTSTAVALDITTQEETMKMYEEFLSNAPLTSSDVQGWEYSNRFDTHLADLLRRAYSMGLTDNQFNLVGSKKHLHALIGMSVIEAFRVLQTSRGTLFSSPVGLITSGALSTFSSNSFKRAYVSEQVANVIGKPLRYQKCAGDDNLDTNERCTSLYKRLGYVITDYSVQEDVFSFCSTTFTAQGSYGDNIEKFFVGCMYDKSCWSDKMLALNNFRYHPRFMEFVDLFDYEAPSDRPDAPFDDEGEKF